jgi:hypothetical protein
MTPLFAVPDSPDIVPPSGRQDSRAPGRGRRPNSRQGVPGNPAKPHKEPPERLRRALGRSFLRYGVSGDVETAVHAAMNVFEPVLDARDTEILRLRRLMGGKLPGR